MDVCTDGAFEFERAPMSTAAELLVGQVGEKAFDLVDPGCAVGREVQWKRGWRSSQRWISGVLWVP